MKSSKKPPLILKPLKDNTEQCRTGTTPSADVMHTCHPRAVDSGVTPEVDKTEQRKPFGSGCIVKIFDCVTTLHSIVNL